ncbi:LOW QUALITY PROTEIN: histone-lysine N-methyltransferase trithorax-like [Atheta coriaria]|uniref:LOW QUALITY PROTEIN: histone-lysine N-methyltransferase trithorax-like n=1 Tax=Dalotia coriaria TaxID=877792 RepID=UPI0031F41BAB
MGRSKFPGKPSKHGNRTRVNVLATNSATGPAPAGIASATAAAAAAAAGGAVSTNGNATNRATAAASDNNPSVVAVGVDDELDEDEERQPINDNLNKTSENLKTSTNETIDKRPTRVCRTRTQLSSNKKKKCSPVKKRGRLLATTSPHPRPLTRSRVTRRTSISGAQLNRSLRRERLERKEREVGKFVLPSRSVHSSRVIKPNKRFISLEQDTRIIRKRVKRQCNINKTVTFADEAEIINNSDDLITTEVKKVDGKANDSPTSLAHGKVLLRQPRLQLNSSKVFSTSTEGPFSVSTSSSPRTITCGVCGAVRFYRFVKNARKFNIFSCESCRKFISKLIKRTTITNTTATLNCLKGQGLCHVPPNVRSQMHKFNQQYNSRCPACWLKLCLRSFQIPMALKTSLTQLLPKYMQPNETNSLPLLSWQATTSTPNGEKEFGAISSRISLSPLASTSSSTTSNVECTSPPSTPPSTQINTNLRQRPVRLKQNVKNVKLPEKTPAPPVVEIKRAKVDMKGPRVKHVCRSASIVLGQLPATFPVDTSNNSLKIEETKEESNKIEEIRQKTKEKDVKIELCHAIDKPEEVQCVNHDIPKEINEILPEKPVVPPPVIFDVEKKPKQPQSQQPVPISMLPMEITNPSFNKKCKKITQLENPNLLNIDFWENYDPDEVVCNGYGVISTEAFPMRAICFLCGSAGKETLVHCCVCCEPYHPYCLEQGPPKFQRPEQRFSWVCPKCTKCSACGEADKQKIHCQKCHKAYHPQCFNHKWRTDDRPTVCSNCLRCKSCGTDNITKFVGNLALCLACFKLRNKGNFCPLCQCCYDDNDFDTKMMECGKCNKWVHAKCEGLSDEHYQILSILPESVEFICCLCCTDATPFWRSAVQQELRSCLNNILRLMSKNRIAREAFKLTPLKASTPHVHIHGHLQSARRLQFVDANNPTNQDEVDVIETELEQDNATTFKNKFDFGDSFNTSASFLNDSKLPISPRMVEIKNKLNCNEYFSLHEFNESMESALQSTSDGKLLEIYHSILKNVLPWFDPTVKEDLNKTTADHEGKTTKNFDNFEIDGYPDDFQSIETIDTRVCNLCKGIGDGLPEQEARLLYCGQNEWIHANCALWSSEVYEEIDGSLQNVQSAIIRGRSIRCAQCKQKGASVGCCLKGCYQTYHFPCAQKANCHFNADRTMYCHVHDPTKDFNVTLITNPHDFAIRRSVYIEVDTKKKKLADREKVHYMVGALSVLSLGKVIPSISDTVDAIIPVGFVCSRLFWSTNEPWKLVPYKITTSVFNSSTETYIDRNFTVDHSLPKNIVERKLKEVSLWQKDDRERSDIYEFEDYEEPQNAGDILSPELTDAILEELPHDLLEGLSMQDMLKEYEELMNLEFRNEINSNDNMSLNMNEKDEQLTDAKDKETSVSVRELKRSKSEVFQKIKDQNRSCSLAYLHLDNTLSPAIKKRKITTPSFMQIVQVDGACDSGSECASPTHEVEDPWAEDGNVKCAKCRCTYRTKISYERHLENCDAAMFTSESENEEASGITTEEQSVIYESFHFKATTATAQNQIKSTSTVLNTLNTQTILEAKTQTVQGVQDSGVVYNYHSHQAQGVKPNMANIVTSQHGVVDNGLLQCIIPVDSIQNGQVLGQSLNIEPILQPVQHQQQQAQALPFATAQDVNFINLDPKLLGPVLNLQQNQLLVRPQHQQQLIQKRVVPKPRSVISKRPIVAPQQRVVQVLPQISQSQPVILQQIPSGINTVNGMSMNMLPFVDASGFQQNANQNVQYVVAPHVNSVQSQPTTQLVQLPDNNFLSLVQNVPQMQPTMIIPQRVETGQIVIDSNGSMIWAPPQMQPVYYGIETVQTTVMQSQHFLPTAMPGMMTTNSSYSATTQVFQTSKLEPCLDGAYVLVNQVNQNQVVNNVQVPPQVQQVQQVQPSQIQIQTSLPNVQQLQNLQIKAAPIQQHHVATPVTIQPQPQQIQQQIPVGSVAPPLQQPQQQKITIPIKVTTTPQLQQHQQQQQPEMKNLQVITTSAVSSSGNLLGNNLITTAPVMNSLNSATTNSANSTSTNSITLPVAPFVPEQGIPTNIVTPTPKPIIQVQPARPMSRVLPMQTSTTQKKPVEPVLEKTESKITVIGEVIIPKHHHQKIPQALPIEPQLTYKLEVKQVNVDELKMRSKEKGRDMPLLAKVHKLEPNDIKLSPKKVEMKKSPQKIEVKKVEVKEDKPEVLKVNKIPVVPLRPIKPKQPLLPLRSEQNKENILCDSTVHEPKYSSKRPNTTSIFFKIESTDGFEYTATSLPQIWRKVFAEVQAARASHNLPPLPDVALRAFNDLDIMGLKTKGLRFLIEQLPDAVKCKQYKPLYHKPKDPYQFEDDDDEDSARRCVAYDNHREKYDMFGWLSSKHRTLEMYDLDAILKKNASSSLPMAMRFRALRVISKYSVGVYRSDIHGRGLFSLRDIESAEMVIEYAGEVIRSVLTDKREKYYNTKGIGCYMFRIDDNLVVDATMKGNAARFINHSCDPNCYSKVVEILGNKHIIIFALRKIICGEELTYDYKFPFEEDKIPCSCGTRRCRKFLN